ncbi:MAG: MptD family putative ECF transporter S component [Eubacteriales bacterium]|nr:MptD family putative ECF transporter S component [Eubacteriales bacterium]
MSRSEKLSTKNIVLIAVCTVLLIILEMLGSVFSWVLGTYGHSLSQGFSGFLSAIVMVFLLYKIPKRFVFSFSFLLLLAIYAMGSFYIPWIISFIVGLALGELALGLFGYRSFLGQAIAYGCVHLGSACGQFIPAWFFPEPFVEHFVNTDMTNAEQMHMFVQHAHGVAGFFAVLITFGLPIVGVYLARQVLKRYLPKVVA